MSWQDKIRNPNCTLCPLHENAEHVCLMGTGKKKAKIMIVGEAPGEREDEQHAAFVGPAGQLLTELLAEVGITREECYITNAVKCRPMGNATPSRAQAKVCQLAYGSKEVLRVRPDWIITLGNVALQALTGKSGITKHRGKRYAYEGIPIFPTFHPAAALRSSHYLAPLRSDFKTFARRIGRDDAGSEGALQLTTRTRLITTPARLSALGQLLRRAPTIAFDLETTGLHEWEEGAKVVTIGVCWAPGECAVVPVHHVSLSNKFADVWWQSLVQAELKKVLEDKSKKFIAHNGKFDCKWLAKFGIYVPLTFDTMIAAHLLDENRAKGLKPLSQMLLGVDDYSEDTKDCYNAPLKKLAIYNGKDCDYTMRLYHIFREELKEEPRLARVFKFLMMPASDAFLRIEMGGVYLDPDRLRDHTHQAQMNVLKLEKYMDQFLPKSTPHINYNSPAQVAVWLFNHLKLPIVERTGKGAPSTKEAVLLRLSKDHKAVRALLKYRKWSKYCSTYLGPWEQRRDSKGRIHPGYRLTGTVTGRLSSSEPNLQQVPRDSYIRGIIGAPDGWQLVEADYSQVELRLAAWAAHEHTMLKILASGEDLHTNTACAITEKKPHAIDKEDRVIWGKHPNFGLIFGMRAKKYQEYCAQNGIYISLKKAEEVYARFHATYPNLRAWHDRQGRLARRYQRVHNALGRVRHLPDVQSASDDVRREAERFAVNSPIQALASDLCLVSAVRLDQTLNRRVARLVGSVHDSLLLEVREDAVEQVVPHVRATMEDLTWVRKKFGARIDVPIEVEIKVGKHWSEGEVAPPSNDV